MRIQCKRVYFPAEKDDGYRVLVDRLWPRGIKKAALVYDEWNKAITPSTELRKAFHSELIDFNHFAQQYRAELAQQHQEGKRLADIARHQPLTLLYAAKDTRQNHAIVLAEWLRAVIVVPPPGLVVCPGTTASNVLPAPRQNRAGHRRRLHRP